MWPSGTHWLVLMHLSFHATDWICARLCSTGCTELSWKMSQHWFNLHHTSCAFPTDFNILWHILNLWGKMHVIVFSLILFLSDIILLQQFSFPQERVQGPESGMNSSLDDHLFWWWSRWHQIYFHWEKTKHSQDIHIAVLFWNLSQMLPFLPVCGQEDLILTQHPQLSCSCQEWADQWTYFPHVFD